MVEQLTAVLLEVLTQLNYKMDKGRMQKLYCVRPRRLSSYNQCVTRFRLHVSWLLKPTQSTLTGFTQLAVSEYQQPRMVATVVTERGLLELQRGGDNTS